MGKPMAMNIARAGFDLVVHDVRPEPCNELAQLGARVAPSAHALAKNVDLIAIAVLDDGQIEAALFGDNGVFAGARPETIVAVHSTVLPGTLRKIEGEAAARRIVLVDAPISGGMVGAYEKRLCYRVGGPENAVNACCPVFATSGSEILRLGEVGSGTLAKIVNQILVCINMLAMFEGVSLAEKAGLDLRLLQRVLHSSAGQSYMADHWFERIERISRSPEALRHQWDGLYKTLSVALECATDFGITLPGTALTRDLMAKIVGYAPDC